MAADPVALRTVAFGELAAGLWGCGWAEEQALVGPQDAHRTTEAAVAVGTIHDTPPAPAMSATLSGAAPEQPWRLAGDELELTVSAISQPVQATGLAGFDQLCRVHGQVSIRGDRRAVDCLGRRASRAGIDFSRIDSLRDLCGWFDPDVGLALTALRPRRARGHAKDTLTAAVFEPEGPRAVAEPRLSSTYGQGGRLLHAGLELWVDDEQEQYPRRAAADALGPGAQLAVKNGLELHAWPLHWRSRGMEGTGVYALASAA